MNYMYMLMEINVKEIPQKKKKVLNLFYIMIIYDYIFIINS